MRSKTKRVLHVAAMTVVVLGGGTTWAMPQTEPATSAQPGSDSADNSEQALCLADPLCKAHFTRARKLSKAEDYEGALAAYQAAYRRREAPWLLVNIGRTVHKLGRPKEAVEYLKQYLSSPGTKPADVQEKAKQFLKEAEQDLASQPAEPTPSPPDGGKSANMGMDSQGRKAPGSVPLSPQGQGVGEQKAPPPPITPPSRWRSVPFLTGVSGGGALLVAGAITGGLALSTSSQLRNTAYVGDPGMTQSNLQQRATTLSRATDVLIPIGAAAVGASVLVTALWRPRAVTPAATDKPSSNLISPAPGSAAAAKPVDQATKPSQEGATEKVPNPVAPPDSSKVSPPLLLTPTAYIGPTSFAVSLTGTF